MPPHPGPASPEGPAGEAARRLEEPIARAARDAGFDLPAGVAGTLAIHLAMTLRWSRAMSLTSITDPAEAIRKHVLESLQAAAHVRPASGGLLDIGSGNGYPALPIKACHPGLPATLLEPALRKSVFLETAARAAGLRDVRVRRERFERPEDLARYPGTGTISMRAVAAVGEVLQGAAGALPPGGRVILLLGRRRADEVAGALPPCLSVAALESLPARAGGAVLVVERT